MDISKSEVGSMRTDVIDYSVPTASTDGAADLKETRWTNSKFPQYLGYYKSIPEVKATISTKAKWVVGKGFKADAKTKEIMDKWRGWGKDTANQILKNLIMTYYIGGDAFAEIIRDKNIFKTIFTIFGLLKKGKPINLKPLDPSSIVVIANKEGMVIRYEQNSKTKGEPARKFKPEDIFHLARDRFADEIHGTSMIEAIENIILMRNEAMADMRIVFHRYVKPLWIWKLDTDDTAKISAFKAKADETVKNAENLYIPKGAAEADRVSVPQYSTLDPLPWIRDLTDYFYQATNTPDIIVGSAKSTVEASAKILYLTFQQSVEEDQLFIEENIKSQLGLDIELEFPASIEADLIKNIQKEGENPVEKNDVQATIKGKK